MRGKGFLGNRNGTCKGPVARESESQRERVSVRAEYRAEVQ